MFRKLNLGQISEKISAFATKARKKIMFKNDLEGATFTISSLRTRLVGQTLHQ